MDAPQSFAELVEQFPDIQDDIAFARALQQLIVATPAGNLPLRYDANTGNVVLDLRSSGIGGGGGSLPSQAGNAGKILTTDGANASWI